MFKSVDELNKEFYALYGDFVENKDSMSAEQRDVMSKILLKRYKRAYKLLEMKEEIELAREEYELNLRMDQFIPRTWRFLFFRRRYNRAAELSGAIIAEEVERYFREQKDALAQREWRVQWDGSAWSVLRWYAATHGKDALLPLRSSFCSCIFRLLLLFLFLRLRLLPLRIASGEEYDGSVLDRERHISRDIKECPVMGGDHGAARK